MAATQAPDGAAPAASQSHKEDLEYLIGGGHIVSGVLPSTYAHWARIEQARADKELSKSQMLGATYQGATASAEYSWRVSTDSFANIHKCLRPLQAPSPPHIHVPQAPDDRELSLKPYHDFQCKPQHKEILIHLTQGSGNSVISRDWKYEWRRQNQQMTQSLYLGPSNAARDVQTLRAEGITMLLAIRDSTMALARFLSGEKVANQLGIEADSIDVAGNPQLIAGFPQAVEKINDHLVTVFQHRVSNGMSPDDPRTRGKVLVFCESGNERSATVVAAYLMHMYNLDEISAIQYIQTQRFCVAFDDALKHLLRSYRELLQARQIVCKATSQTRVVSKAKRGRDDMDMDDDTEFGAEQQDDVERFGKRSAFTPFH